MCASRTTPYATAKARARSPNASGTQSAATSSAAIAANTATRTAPSSGSITLVSQAYAVHAHHSRREDEHAPADAGPGRLVVHERGALREPEDEDEVEEQLERLDRLLLAQLGRQPGSVGSSERHCQT